MTIVASVSFCWNPICITHLHCCRFENIREFVALQSTTTTMLSNGIDDAYELRYVNSINNWAEVRSAEGLSPNIPINSNDEPPGNNQQRLSVRGYARSEGPHMQSSAF